jgi:hypothetical protein
VAFHNPHNPNGVTYQGIPDATIQQWYSQVLLAEVQVASGGKGEAFSYAQGEGSRSVTYTRANLDALIRMKIVLKAELVARGLLTHARRARRSIGFSY